MHGLAVGLYGTTASPKFSWASVPLAARQPVNPGAEGFPRQPVENTADGGRQRKSRPDVVDVAVVGGVTGGVAARADWMVSTRSATSGSRACSSGSSLPSFVLS